MRTHSHGPTRRRFRACLVGGLCVLTQRTVLAQGPLVPPGPPSTTMRSLDQIEPRKVVDRLPFAITEPGAYVVSRNLSYGLGDGIAVSASDVTLDLNGFVLTGDPDGTGHAIAVADGVRNVEVRNGTLRHWPDDGVHAPYASDVVLLGLRVYACGGDGCETGAARIEDVVVRDNADAGLRLKGDPSEDILKFVVKKIAAGGNGGGGVVVDGWNMLGLSHCDLSGNTGAGLTWTPAPSSGSLRLSADSCLFDGNSGDGLFVDGGSNHVIRLADSSFSGNGGAGQRIRHDTAKNSIQNIRARAEGNDGGGIAYIGPCDASFADSSIQGNTGHGIDVSSASPTDAFRLALARCEVSDNTGDGLHMVETGGIDQDCDFVDTSFLRNGGDGVKLHFTGIDSRLNIVHRGGGASSNGGHGISLHTAGREATQGFFDLVLQRNGQSGFSETCSPASACRVENVVALANGTHGIEVAGGKNFSVARCTVSRNGADGIVTGFPQRHPFGRGHVTVLKLSDSDVGGNGGNGLLAADSEDEALFRVVVRDSSLSGNEGDGVLVSAGRSGSAASLVWEESAADGNASNGVRVASGAGSDGVRVTMTGGSCGNNALAGILIADNGVKPGSVNRVNASGNGGHGIDSAGDGFSIAGVLAFGNAGSGIRVTGTGHDLVANQCRANAVGIELVGAGNAVRENSLSGAAQTPIVDGGGNARAPTQAVDTGTNPLGNLAF